MHIGGKAAIHLAGSISYALAQWAIIVSTSRLISFEATGTYSYYLSIFTPAAIILSFGIRNSISSDTHKKHTWGDYQAAKHIGLFTLTLIYIIIISIESSPQKTSIATIVFLIKFFDNLSETYYGNLVRSGESHKYGVSKILKLASFLIIYLALYILDSRGEEVLYSYPLSLILVYIFYDRKNAPREKPTPSASLKKTFEAISNCAPLAIGSFLISLNTSIPRIAIEDILGEHILAEYVAITYFTVFATIPITSICQALMPSLSLGHLDKQTHKIYLSISTYGVLFTIAIVILAEPLVKLIYSTNIQYTLPHLTLVGISGLLYFLATFGNSILVSRRRFRNILRISIVLTTSTAIFTPLLISTHGAGGAYWGLLLSSTILAISTIYEIHKSTPQKKVAAAL